MSGEEIDKIFREGLKDHVAPTTDADWAAFEKSLPSRKGGATYWMIALLALTLIGSGYAALRYMDQENKQYTAREGDFNTNTVLTDDTEISNQTDLMLQKESYSSNESISQTADREDDIIEGDQIASEESGQEKRTTEMQIGKAEEQSQDYHRTGDDQSLYSTQSSLSEAQSMSSPVPKSASSSASSGEGPFSLNPLTEEEFQIGAATLMSMKSAQVDLASENQNLAGSAKEVDKQVSKKFWPSIYFKLEENTVLGTSPSIGIALRRDMTSLGKGILSVQAGLGYQRTGRLSWIQERSEVNYGFDRYETEYELLTDNLDLIQIPLLVNYQLGVHNFMAGLEGNFIVDASQIFRENESSGDESGYLYDSGAPDFSMDFTAAYGYNLTERFRLDLGATLGDRIWEPANERPVGGFIRLNYFVK